MTTLSLTPTVAGSRSTQPVRADSVSVETRPFTFSEIRDARHQTSLAVLTTIIAAASTVTIASALIVLIIFTNVAH